MHAPHAKRFGLLPQRGVFGASADVGGALKTTRSSIENLRLGALEVRQTHLMVADLSQVEAVLARLSRTPIHGIIGQDVMREHHAVIDVSRSILYALETGSAPAPVPAERCKRAAGAPQAG